jgi:hypothetical protein
VYKYMYMHIHVCVCVCPYVRAYVGEYTHKYTHTLSLLPAARFPRKKSQKPTSAAGRQNISLNLSLNAKLSA